MSQFLELEGASFISYLVYGENHITTIRVIVFDLTILVPVMQGSCCYSISIGFIWKRGKSSRGFWLIFVKITQGIEKAILHQHNFFSSPSLSNGLICKLGKLHLGIKRFCHLLHHKPQSPQYGICDCIVTNMTSRWMLGNTSGSRHHIRPRGRKFIVGIPDVRPPATTSQQT